MTKKKLLLERRNKVVPVGVGSFAGDTTADRAKGGLLWGVDGEELIDFAGGIGVMNVGHCDDRVVKAIQEQAARLIHTCIHVATYEPYVALCEKLVEILPHGAETRAFLLNSGAEAVENAIKVARQATGRQAVICYTEAFHGRTLLGMTLTSKTGYKIGCGPFASEIYRLPFPNHYHDHDGLDLEAFVARELERLEEAFTILVPAEHVAAIILEPVQGEGGFLPVPKAYMQGLRRICDERGIMLICDEVQSGFGRTGAWGSYEHYGIIPDISTWAKSMGGGMPISAVIGRAEVMDKARPGTLGGTYGGNPVACAAALATIASMEAMDINRRGREIGDLVRSRFERLAKTCPVIGEVRGIGAMIGIELSYDRKPNRPAGPVVQAVIADCRSRGLLVLPAGPYGNVLRILSPLSISDAELNRGLDILEASILEHQAVESK